MTWTREWERDVFNIYAGLLRYLIIYSLFFFIFDSTFHFVFLYVSLFIYYISIYSSIYIFTYLTLNLIFLLFTRGKYLHTQALQVARWTPSVVWLNMYFFCNPFSSRGQKYFVRFHIFSSMVRIMCFWRTKRMRREVNCNEYVNLVTKRLNQVIFSYTLWYVVLFSPTLSGLM